MSLPVIILGGGGHAKVLIEALRASSVAILGITDPDPAKVNAVIMSIAVLGDDAALTRHDPGQVRLVNGLGSVNVPRARTALFERCKNQGYSFAAVVHPAAVVASDALLGEGAQVMAGAVIQPGCRIGRNTIINTHATVDHDCLIGDHVHLAPGVILSGGVRVGDRVHVGTGTSILQGVQIGPDSLIGAGSLVLEDIAAGAKVVGRPAREAGR